MIVTPPASKFLIKSTEAKQRGEEKKKKKKKKIPFQISATVYNIYIAKCSY